MSSDDLRPTLFRSVPITWSTSLTFERTLATLARLNSEDGWLDVGHDDVRVRIRGDRVRIVWCARGERYHCVLDARARSVPGGTELEGCFRLPRMFSIVLAFVAAITVLWGVLVVGSIIDFGLGGILMAAIPGIFWLALLPVLAYGSSRAGAEARSIHSFVERALESSPAPGNE